MLYQQINDLAITGHNWLWNKGYNILSVSLQLFNTWSGFLLLVLPQNSTCPVYAPYSQLPLSIPWRGQLLLSSLYLSSEASGKQAPSPPLSITFNHLNAYSAFCPFRLPPHFVPSPAFLFTLAISQLQTTASLITVLHLSISICFQLFSSPPSCLCLMRLPLTFPLCLRVFLSWRMLYSLHCTRMEDVKPVHPPV